MANNQCSIKILQPDPEMIRKTDKRALAKTWVARSSSSFSAVPTEVTDAPLSSEALQELLEFDVEALTRETLQPWLDLRFAVDAIHRGCLLPPASASAPEEAGTAATWTSKTPIWAPDPVSRSL